jgi:hypothetical protein
MALRLAVVVSQAPGLGGTPSAGHRSTAVANASAAASSAIWFFADRYVLNANDWLSNVSSAPRPQNKYYYPGGTLGGRRTRRCSETVPETVSGAHMPMSSGYSRLQLLNRVRLCRAPESSNSAARKPDITAPCS